VGDILQKGSDWLGRQRRAHASREVIYQRQSSSVSVPATIGRTEFEQDDGGGFPVQVHTTDFLIDVADLELDGIPVEPSRGDRIIDGRIDEGVVFEVMPIPGGHVWRFADEYRKVYRIHTKQVETRP
jgi:hypothetical protein